MEIDIEETTLATESVAKFLYGHALPDLSPALLPLCEDAKVISHKTFLKSFCRS